MTNILESPEHFHPLRVGQEGHLITIAKDSRSFFLLYFGIWVNSSLCAVGGPPSRGLGGAPLFGACAVVSPTLAGRLQLAWEMRGAPLLLFLRTLPQPGRVQFFSHLRTLKACAIVPLLAGGSSLKVLGVLTVLGDTGTHCTY